MFSWIIGMLVGFSVTSSNVVICGTVTCTLL